ncbi:hypothetical protein P6P90_04170 [Ectobacillus antri]|uniref:Uncharacterized protein n=1 Tax=Ectobacillus antri TaxID=2486280 RepID=A0ABT6H1B8_9BACI|nr:hypothetical protein [Ectobacillus antri]MDG4655437.1 hypothetical protein [Ectobacillus antri]MDG5753195.1 hypothetical protein [Ectobacillus antri]
MMYNHSKQKFRMYVIHSSKLKTFFIVAVAIGTAIYYILAPYLSIVFLETIGSIVIIKGYKRLQKQKKDTI